jgi:hypothetical protein
VQSSIGWGLGCEEFLRRRTLPSFQHVFTINRALKCTLCGTMDNEHYVCMEGTIPTIAFVCTDVQYISYNENRLLIGSWSKGNED